MISVEDIKKIQQKRKKILKDTYTAIYHQFCKKIKTVVEVGGYSVTLSVPFFVMGHPTFNRERATNYLVRQLKNAGFSVSLSENLIILVTWTNNTHNNSVKHDTPDEDLPTLINLKKVANHLRKS